MSPPEECIHRHNGLLLHIWNDVTVSIRRQAYTRMPQEFADDLGMDSLL